MKTVSDFRVLADESNRVPVLFDGRVLELREGENLAAELLASGVMPFRKTPVSGAPRNPFCMMGACFDCLVEIDGVSRQACMTLVRADMDISMPAIAEIGDA